MERRPFFVAGIGASAGGHQALEEFFLNTAPDSGIAYCVITHLLRDHHSVLDKIISRYTPMPVKRMKGFDLIQPDTVYVMPEGVKAYLRRGALILKPRPLDEVLNKTIDEFFYSLAEDRKELAVGIVLSGMGDDGSKGVQAIHEFGGTVLVQEPHSAVFNSMPDQAIKRDSPDKILPPAVLAKSLLKVVETKKNLVQS